MSVLKNLSSAFLLPGVLTIALVPLPSRPAVAAQFYSQTNLVSDGFVPDATFTDPNLVNPWGVAYSPTGPFWVSNQGTGTSTLYNGNGEPQPLVVTIPQSSSVPTGPTGQIFNATSSFNLSTGGKSGPGLFFFSNLDGSISGWNPSGDPTAAVQVVPSSSSAIYLGLASGSNSSGDYLYATNDLTGKVDVFDANFNPAQLSGDFTDPDIPEGLVPSNIQNIDGKLYVAFAPPGPESINADLGAGAVSVFDTDGNLLQHLTEGGQLASPWGLAIAPDDFGPFSNALLVGNFNNDFAFINAFDPDTGEFLGTLEDSQGKPLSNPGLWALAFGNGGDAGATNELFITAGLNNEQNGLFAKVEAVPEPSSVLGTLAAGTFGAGYLLRRRATRRKPISRIKSTV